MKQNIYSGVDILKGVDGMAEYKRLVSYIYNYDSGIRQKNVGFSRVESKNGQCKVTIHITASISSQENLKVYLFRRSGTKIEGIYFGAMTVKNGTGDFKAETNTYALMDSPYSLDDICGVLLLLNKGKFFGSQWDDEPIQINNFIVFDAKKIEEERVDRLVKNIHVEPQNVHEMLMEEELASSLNEPEEEEMLQAANIEEVAAAMSSMQSFFQERENSDNEQEMVIEDSVSEDDRLQEAGAKWGSDEETEAEIVKSASVAEENQVIEIEQTRKVESLVEEESSPVSQCSIEENPKLEAEDLGNSCCCSDNYPDCVRSILKSFPSVKPFPNSQPELWVRIEPKDIGMLPVETWALANNSFLLHGYYNHRHLVFGIHKVGETFQYVIGVPGIMQDTEQKMAGMFGFHRFLSANSDDAEHGSFGYWIQQIVL
ncbi:MAG: hypothetical protein IKL07_07955 [Clostridium sp.]|nr:hypothetical protein [Clostridium sp.]